MACASRLLALTACCLVKVHPVTASTTATTEKGEAGKTVLCLTFENSISHLARDVNRFCTSFFILYECTKNGVCFCTICTMWKIWWKCGKLWGKVWGSGEEARRAKMRGSEAGSGDFSFFVIVMFLYKIRKKYSGVLQNKCSAECEKIGDFYIHTHPPPFTTKNENAPRRRQQRGISIPQP